MINLDANASVPIRNEARQTLLNALSQSGNASSPHTLGRQQRQRLDAARSAVAAALRASEKQIIFNSGASEGNRWLVDAVVLAGQLRGAPMRVMASHLEHPSLMKPLQYACAQGSMVWAENIENADLIFICDAHSETGKMVDWPDLLARIPPNAILLSDAAQSFGRAYHLPDRVDGIVVSAHKIGAVAGCGALCLRGNARNLPAPWAGGGQEGGLRPGSESLPLIAAFGAVATNIETIRQEHAKLAVWRDEIEQKLLAAWPFARVVGAEGKRLPNTTAITLSGVDGEALRIAIDSAGVCVGFGSACSALAPEPSSALLSLGLSPSEARATIRISLSPCNTESEIAEAISRLIPVGIGLTRKS